mmetsp:Transcript_31110/g.107530  ORF Transcript_31110/g.107530 Transcript_31110/m.107530 type:complete len:97 (-) Transcript_31110:191-481(-)
MGHAAERERRRQLGHAAEPERRRQLVLPGYCFCFFSFFFFGPCSMRCGRLSRSAELIGACIRVLHLPPPPPPPPGCGKKVSRSFFLVHAEEKTLVQ